MDMVLGSLRIRYHKWDSIGELQRYLDNCKLGYIIINNTDYPVDNYSLTVVDENGNFGVGLISYTNGIAPSLLLDNKHLLIVWGHGKNICIIDLDKRRIVSQLESDYDFYQFHSLNHLGIDDFFIVHGEIEIIAIRFDGMVIWKYVAEDIISSFSVEKDLTIKLFDSNFKNLQLLTGLLS